MYMLDMIRKLINSRVNLVEAVNNICPVTSVAVDTMGDLTRAEYRGRAYNLCCAGCLGVFDRDPERFSRKAEEDTGALRNS